MLYQRFKVGLARVGAFFVVILPLTASPLAGVGIAHATIPVPEMVSLDNGDDPMANGASDGFLSDNGRYVAFQSTYYDEYSNPVGTSYVRDRTNGSTATVSILPNNTQPDYAVLEFFSGDGNHVVFGSGGTDYIRTAGSNSTSAISYIDENSDPVNGTVQSISDDGGKITYGDSNGHSYLQDLSNNSVVRLSDAEHSIISGNGDYVLYWSSNTSAYVYDVSGETSVAASGNASHLAGQPVISDDGRYVAFAASGANRPLPRTGSARVFRYDIQNDEFEYADVLDSGLGPVVGWSDFGDSASLAISGDGNVVAFGCTNLGGFTGDTTTGATAWYAHNFTTDKTGLVTTDGDGTQVAGAPEMYLGSLSGDGSLTTFESNDSNLGIGDEMTQVFVNSTTGTGAADMTAPVLDTFSIDPAGVEASGTYEQPFSVPVSDDLTGVYDGEYYIGSDPGEGNGTPMTRNSNGTMLNGTLTGTDSDIGTRTVNVRARDAAGNWSSVGTADFEVDPL